MMHRTTPQPDRVLQVVGTMDRGGAETMLMNVYRSIDRTALQFDFLVFTRYTGAYEQEILDLGGRILRLDLHRRGGALRAICDMARVIREAGPFLAVHSHVNFASAGVIVAARLAGVPRRIAHGHIAGHDQADSSRTAYRMVARSVLGSISTDALACGDEAGRYVLGRSWRTRGRILHNPISNEWLDRPDDEQRQMVRTALGAKPGDVLLGCVGRLAPQKNHRFLIHTVSAAVKGGHSVKLVIVGDGPLRSELEQTVGASGLQEHVRFLGVRSDVHRLVAGLDVMVLPSLYEGLPMVLVEAQAAGTACIVSDQVTREADVGLGLVKFVPLKTEHWVEAIAAPPTSDATATYARQALQSRGFLVPEAITLLNRIYRAK